jgi:hypothetical protein
VDEGETVTLTAEEEAQILELLNENTLQALREEKANAERRALKNKLEAEQRADEEKDAREHCRMMLFEASVEAGEYARDTGGPRGDVDDDGSEEDDVKPWLPGFVDPFDMVSPHPPPAWMRFRTDPRLLFPLRRRAV